MQAKYDVDFYQFLSASKGVLATYWASGASCCIHFIFTAVALKQLKKMLVALL